MRVSDLTCRQFSEKDIESVAELAEQLGLSHWSRRDYIAELARKDSYMQIAEKDDELAGFMVGRFVPGSRAENMPDAEIYNIGVNPNYHRSGVGGLILSAFIGQCRSKEVEFIWLEVRKMNIAAISFYEKAGFTQFTERRGFYNDPPDDGIIMRLDLPQIDG